MATTVGGRSLAEQCECAVPSIAVVSFGTPSAAGTAFQNHRRYSLGAVDESQTKAAIANLFFENRLCPRFEFRPVCGADLEVLMGGEVRRA
jgi:hypothetical protein